MIKAVYLPLCLLLLCATGAPAQTPPADTAINEAVLRQANTIVLRQTLAEAKHAASRGDLAGAAKRYQESVELAQRIGSGIQAETAQAVSGLVSTRLALARRDQGRGDYHNADVEVGQALKVDPHNSAALAFKKDNDHRMQLMAGRLPDASTIEQIPVVGKDKVNAATAVQDGKLFYEMGKLDEADAKLKAALELDPDNQAAFYYLNLVKQARYSRESLQHTADTQQRMNQVEKMWVLPKNSSTLPEIGNPYATNTDIHTGPGREIIMAKLDRIHLDNVSYDGLPLNEVLRDLQAKAQARDFPDKRGINFIINPNADNSGIAPAPQIAGGLGGTGGGGGVGGVSIPTIPGAGAGAGAPGAVDPTTGIAAPAAGAAPAEAVDIGTDVLIKLNLSDVRLADVIDAIKLVANKPIKYSILDYGIVFQARDSRYEPPTLVTRTFKVDPNTFYSGLESVSGLNFGSLNSSGGGGGGSSGGGRSGGGGGGGSSGGGGNQNSGGVVGVVDAVPGGSSARSGQGNSGGGGGGGGNRGGNTGGGNTGANGGTGNLDSGNGGLRYITRLETTSDISLQAQRFFSTLGVNLAYPKSVFFNDRLGLLVVRATEQDLDTIEQAMQVLNRVAPQVHIKARFIEVQQTDDKALGFDWYLGNFVNGSVVANGGSAPSLNTGSTSAANPLGTFPGNTTVSQVAPSATDQSLTSGLRNSLNAPALATVTGIMTDPNFRVAIRALQQRSGVETLAEPEAVTTSGRQTQMKATQLKTVIVDINFQQGSSGVVGGIGGNVGGGGGG